MHGEFLTVILSCRARRFMASFVCIFVVFVVFVDDAFAANRFNFLRVRPNADGGEYFFVQESTTLPQLGFNVGTELLYYNQPLNIDLVTRLVRRTGGTTTVTSKGGLDHPVFQWFYGALGVTDWFSLMFDFPLFYAYRFRWTTGGVTSTNWQYGAPGDMNLTAKFRVLDLDRHPVGIALIPSITVPTGKESHFLGDQGVTGEGRLVVEVKPVDKLRVAFNAAFQTRERVTIGNFSFRDVFKFSVGANYRVIESTSIIAEIETQTATNDFYGSRQTSPAEARLGAKWRSRSGISVGGGGSAGIIYGGGMPWFGAVVIVAYTHKPKPKRKVRVDVLDETPACTRLYDDGDPERYTFMCSVFFGFDDASVQAEDREVVEAIAQHILERKGIVAVEVRGWTDTIGTKSYNKALARRRAKAVERAIERELARIGGQAEIRVRAIGEDALMPREKARRAETLLR